MGLLILDYFKCEAFEFNFRLHVLGGFWPLETNVKWKQILFSIFSFLCYFSITSMIIIQGLDVYLLRNDPVGLTKDLCSISISYTVVTKSILIFYKIDLVNYLRQKFTEYKNSQKNPIHMEILENSNKTISLVPKTLNMMMFPCVVFWMLYPGLDSKEKRVPFPYRLPVEEWTFPVYVGLYVYQSFAMLGFMINVLAVDSMFCGFILRINSHYDVIIKDLEGLGNLEERDFKEARTVEVSTKLAKRTLRKCVELHQTILGDIKVLEEIYSLSCLIHVAGMTTIIGTAIIDFVRVAKGFRIQILQKLLYVAITLWDTFLYCYCASQMQQKSLELCSAVYGVSWYNLQPKFRKDLMFILFKCQNVPRIKVAHLFYLNLQSFVSFLKISYDLTALLFQTVKE